MLDLTNASCLMQKLHLSSLWVQYCSNKQRKNPWFIILSVIKLPAKHDIANNILQYALQ